MMDTHTQPDGNTAARLRHESMEDAQTVVQEQREAMFDWNVVAESEMATWPDESWAESARDLPDYVLAAIMRSVTAQVTDFLIGHGSVRYQDDESKARSGIISVRDELASATRDHFVETGEL